MTHLRLSRVDDVTTHLHLARVDDVEVVALVALLDDRLALEERLRKHGVEHIRPGGRHVEVVRNW